MPTSPRPFKNQTLKDFSSQNPFIKPKNMVRSKLLDGERKERIKRKNIIKNRNI